MLFVDGENLTARAQAMAKERDVTFETGPHFKRDVFIWLPGLNPRQQVLPPHIHQGLRLDDFATRAHFYTSTVGGEGEQESVARSLRDLHFQPVVFRKGKGQRSKGVDISLTKDMLWHAFYDHYDVAVLCSGDADYVPVVQAVQRLGKIVHVLALSSGLGEALRDASDDFFNLDLRFNQFPIVKPPKEGP